MSTAPNLREEVIRRNLEKAIQTMREAVDKAERDLARRDPADPGDTLHALTWGLANASSHIQAAMSWRETGHAEAMCHAHLGNVAPESKQ
jgi:hypothetical protein